MDCVIQEKRKTGSTFTTSFSTAPSLYLLPAITSTENFKSIFVFLASSNMEMALFILVMHRHSCKLVGWLLMIGWNKKWAYKFYAFLCRYMGCFVWNIMVSHTKTLSHLHSGYRSFCAGCLAALQTNRCCLAMPKRPWMQMQRSSFDHTIAMRAYCQQYYCGIIPGFFIWNWTIVTQIMHKWIK